MCESIEIVEYRDFYDVPRIFIVEFNRKTYLFDCPFDEEVDDYGDSYTVMELPAGTARELPEDWSGLGRTAEREVGSCLVQDVTFDGTRRSRIDATVFSQLGE